METTTNYRLMSASDLTGYDVKNDQGENLGDIKEIMIDTEAGCIAYAVLSFGGFLGLGDKYFAIPWEALKFDREREHVILNVDKEKLKNAPGFDKDKWPSSPDRTFVTNVHEHFGYKPYWERQRTEESHRV